MDSLRLNCIWVLSKRELRSTLYGFGVYLAILISLLISAVILQNYLKAVGHHRMLISASPLAHPLFIATSVCAIYLALTSVTSIARERDTRTLEALFYGPVDHVSYILGKYVKSMLSYVFIVFFLAGYFVFMSRVLNLGLSTKFLGVLLLSFFLSSCVVSFGIFISTLTQSVRTSVLVFLGIVGGLITIQVTHGMLVRMAPENLPPPLIYLRNTVSIVNGGVKWVSPFHYLLSGREAVSLGTVRGYAVSGSSSVIYSAVALVLSLVVLKWRGIRKTTGE